MEIIGIVALAALAGAYAKLGRLQRSVWQLADDMTRLERRVDEDRRRSNLDVGITTAVVPEQEEDDAQQ